MERRQAPLAGRERRDRGRRPRRSLLDRRRPADRRRAEHARLLAARKPLDGRVSGLVNRRLSRPISLVVLRAVSRARRPSPPSSSRSPPRRCSRSGRAAGGTRPRRNPRPAGVHPRRSGRGDRARLAPRIAVRGFLDSVLDRAADAAVLAALAVAAGLDATTWALLAAALAGSHDAVREGGLRGGYRRPWRARSRGSTRGATCASSSPPLGSCAPALLGPRRARDLDERRGRAALRRRRAGA